MRAFGKWAIHSTSSCSWGINTFTLLWFIPVPVFVDLRIFQLIFVISVRHFLFPCLSFPMLTVQSLKQASTTLSALISVIFVVSCIAITMAWAVLVDCLRDWKTRFRNFLIFLSLLLHMELDEFLNSLLFLLNLVFPKLLEGSWWA